MVLLILMVVTVLVFVKKKSSFQSKTQKQQNTKQTLVLAGRISQNVPQLDHFVRFQCFVKTRPLQFWAKNAQAPQRC